MLVPTQGVQYRPVELRFDAEASVTAVEISAPDQIKETRLPFLSQPIHVTYDEEGIEHVTEQGDAFLCCRFTPKASGIYHLTAKNGADIVAEATMEIAPSSEHGYLLPSQTDRRYLTFSDGSGCFPLGINLSFPFKYGKSNGKEFGLTSEYRYMGLRQYDYWFRRCAEQGVTLARIWVGHDYFTPDTETIGEFRGVQFSKIDALVEMARKYGIRLKFTLEQFRFFCYEKKDGNVFNLFNKNLYDAAGNRCESAREWLTEEKWQEGWLCKVEEFAKRYADDPTVAIIELWNEMNCVGLNEFGQQKEADNFEAVLAWNCKILPRVKALFPRQMVTNSLGSMDAQPWLEYYRDFCWDACDLMQFHRYLDQGARFTVCNSDPISLIQDGFTLLETGEKPLLLAETGAVNNCHSGPFKYYSKDDRGILFVDCVYTPVFLGSCTTGHIWHWDERYVESKNLYHLFAPLQKLTEGVDFLEEAFVCKDYSDDRAIVLVLEGRHTVLGFVRNRQDNWKNTLRDGNSPTPIDRLSLPASLENEAEIFPIWAEDAPILSKEASDWILSGMKYGILFRGKK